MVGRILHTAIFSDVSTFAQIWKQWTSITFFLILQSAWRVLIQHFWFLNYTFPSPGGVFMVLFEV